ncbi:MAG: hypothetical protein K0R47_2205 [Brevibacillus sp.]|nr:hypothetical protein [Brevibacillus sp.]
MGMSKKKGTRNAVTPIKSDRRAMDIHSHLFSNNECDSDRCLAWSFRSEVGGGS